MQSISSPLSRYEQIIFSLRALFSGYGYTRCRVRTFEQYDFYARNRSALSGEEVLIFSDADGRLMALKPDVTMSIVKNIQDDVPQKLCYNENIYRVPAGGNRFRESVQTGLECIGELDQYAVAEVLMLAVKSLAAVSDRYILDLSHIGILEGLLDQALDENQDPTPILRAMEQKNFPALEQICRDYGLDSRTRESLKVLICLYGPLKDTLPRVEAIAAGEKMKAACWELRGLENLMEAYGLSDHIHLDFSIRGGSDYYSGLMMRGFVDGVPGPVLRGGQYDKLIHRMGKISGGIGFAVYLDQLDPLPDPEPDEDVLLLYRDSTPAAEVIRAVDSLRSQGLRVRAERKIPKGCLYGKLLTLTDKGVDEVE